VILVVIYGGLLAAALLALVGAILLVLDPHIRRRRA
jgi:hypothetical protein